MSRIYAAILLAAALGSSTLAAAQLPTVETGGAVYIHATFPTDPAAIAFDSDDNLIVGNFNSPGPPDVPAPVWIVSAADSSVAACAAVDDPDAVYVDRDGLYAAPGTILIGGWRYTTNTGQIVGVPGGCGAPSVLAFGGGLGNISSFAQDALGRLFVSNGSELDVLTWNGTSWIQFISPTTGNQRIVIDGPNYFVSSLVLATSIVRRYDANGTLLDPAFARGSALAIGPHGSVFEGLVVSRPDSVLAVDPVTKQETLILVGAGLQANFAAFDSAGDLYISQGGAFDRILHVTQGETAGVGLQAGGASELDLRVTPNPARASATVRFAGSAAVPARLDLLDTSGRRILPIYDGIAPRNGLQIELPLDRLARGIYFIAAVAGEERRAEKVVLVR